MTELRCIGIDPGPTPGFVVLHYFGLPDSPRRAVVDVVQCSHKITPLLFDTILDSNHGARTVVGIESFIVGRRAGRSSSAKAGAITRNLIGELERVWAETNYLPERSYWYARTASRVKPWATDQRLEAAGLLAATKGMRHSRDAARHALYAAVKDGGIPDPLSKAGR